MRQDRWRLLRQTPASRRFALSEKGEPGHAHTCADTAKAAHVHAHVHARARARTGADGDQTPLDLASALFTAAPWGSPETALVLRSILSGCPWRKLHNGPLAPAFHSSQTNAVQPSVLWQALQQTLGSTMFVL
mmetsp:Transcript_90379/g.251480  ORF Transcript_90379/g.251480 Transcript_90379/m.251480 type:complete len:133 (-) Transcript_90379:800-1198(-)